MSSIQNVITMLDADFEMNTSRAGVPEASLLEPWGEPVSVRARTVYPELFPRELRELCGLIPLQDRPIGRNIRPVVADVLMTNFSLDALSNMAALLSLAYKHILKDFALIVTDICLKCFEAPERESIVLAQDGTAAHWIRVFEWVGSLGDDRRLSRTALPLDVQTLLHLFMRHTEFTSRPNPYQRVRIDITPCSGKTIYRQGTVEDIHSFVALLPIVAKEELGHDDRCNICLGEDCFQGLSQRLLARTVSVISAMSGGFVTLLLPLKTFGLR